MDVQTILIIIIVLLTINFVLLIAYVILVLKEARKTIIRINELIDAVKETAESIKTPFSSLSSLAAGFAEGYKIVEVLKERFTKDTSPENKS
ncbi:hypothetical protein COT49_01265 [candidate division WWE3 bacterium CG08_land_8_20_14_0_20_40_13]|uniref:DUF948 domain-containing protein n=1 Tax=candidate division WWE3 bacterium CG08_land_8_20_14_0_20_40_13 TaxID=1975084 RepID=A0A2H0XE71_UNCKA|nr:MAG: hypothetical protein COT49_01265 [candidate division WWE3 bacterium CG08_land_8_20_14_0_20_40_13]